MRRIIFLALALVLIASMFFIAVIATATISIPRIGIASVWTLRIEKVAPLGDPINGGGPPGFTP